MPNYSHDCLEHLKYREREWVETHGLDCGPYERCWEAWWQCVICGAQFTSRELDAIYEELNKNDPDPAT
jgi:hypothetical protein